MYPQILLTRLSYCIPRYLATAVLGSVLRCAGHSERACFQEFFDIVHRAWRLSLGICVYRYVGMLACWKNSCEPRKFGEPIHLSDVYLPVHATQYIRTGRGKDSEKQSITGYEIMTSIRPSYLRSTMTERFNGYEGCIVLQNANMLPCFHLNGQPHRR